MTVAKLNTKVTIDVQLFIANVNNALNQSEITAKTCNTSSASAGKTGVRRVTMIFIVPSENLIG